MRGVEAMRRQGTWSSVVRCDAGRVTSQLMKMNSFDVEQHVGQVGPDRRSVVQASSASPTRGLRVRGIAAPRRVSPASAAGEGGRGTSPRSAVVRRRALRRPARARPRAGLLDDERVVHQDQRLGRHVRDVPPADRRERDRRVEGEHHRRQEVAADRQVDAAPAVAVERAARGRSAAAVHERRQVDRARSGRTAGRRAGRRRRASRRGSPRLPAGGSASGAAAGSRDRPCPPRASGAARHPVGARQHQRADQRLDRPAVADEPVGQVVEQFRVRRRARRARRSCRPRRRSRGRRGGARRG